METIEVPVSDELLEQLDAQVRQGHAPGRTEYVLQLLESDLARRRRRPDEAVGSSGRTMAEILAPIQESVRQSGMTPEEVNAFLDETLAEVRRERRQRREAEERTAHD